MIQSRHTAGTTFAAAVVATAYPAGDWTCTLHLRGPVAVDLVAVPDGHSHRVEASAEQTSSWPPGVYWWAARVSDGATVVQIDEGQIEILADLTGISAPHDGRTHAEKVLSAIEAVIENRATIDQQKYTINNRELWRTPIADLLLLRARYQAELQRERMAKKTGQSLLGRQVKVRMP